MAKSSKLAEAFVEIRTDDSKFRTGLSRVRKDITSTQSVMVAFAKGGSTILKGFIGGLGISAALSVWQMLGDGIRHAVNQTKEGETSQAKLRSTFRSLGHEVERNVAWINQFADVIRANTGVSGDMTRSLVTMGLNLGINADQIDRVVAAAIGLSEVTGDDVTASMEALTKALNGNFAALERNLPAVRNAVSTEQKLAVVQKIAQQGLQQRKAATQTLAGATDRLSAAYDDLTQSIGDGLSPALVAAANYATTLIRTLTSGTTEARVAMLELQKTLLKLGSGNWLSGNWAPKVQAQLDALDAEINRITNDAIKGTDAQTDSQLKLQKAVNDTNDSYSDAFGIYRKAQEAAMKQANMTIAATKAEAKAKEEAAKAPRNRNDQGRWSAAGMNAEIRRREDAARRATKDPSTMTAEEARKRYQRVKDELDQLPGGRDSHVQENAPGVLGREQLNRRERLEKELLGLSAHIRGEGSKTAANLDEYTKRKKRELDGIDIDSGPKGGGAKHADMEESLERRRQRLIPKIDAEREKSGVPNQRADKRPTTGPAKVTFNSEVRLLDVLTKLESKIDAVGGLA